MGKSLHRVVKRRLKKIISPPLRSLFALCMFPSAIFASANEPYQIEWRSVNIEAYDDRVGLIKLEAKETNDGGLQLSIVSDLMKGQFPLNLTEDIDDPNIKSLSIQVTELYDAELSEFSICLWYGKTARINVGSEDSPKYRWQQRQVTYIVSGSGVSRKIYSNADVLKISSCNPS